MPSKSHRAASRQAELQRKKRRGKGHPQSLVSEPAEATVAEAAVEPAAAGVQPGPGVEATPPAIQPRPQLVRRIRRGALAQPVPAYKYLGTELRQIGIIMGLIVVVLVVLTVVLRS